MYSFGVCSATGGWGGEEEEEEEVRANRWQHFNSRWGGWNCGIIVSVDFRSHWTNGVWNSVRIHEDKSFGSSGGSPLLHHTKHQ